MRSGEAGVGESSRRNEPGPGSRQMADVLGHNSGETGVGLHPAPVIPAWLDERLARAIAVARHLNGPAGESDLAAGPEPGAPPFGAWHGTPSVEDGTRLSWLARAFGLSDF